MEKKSVRTGIIGAGFAATFHFECLKKVHGTNVDVKGVFATDTDQAATYAKKRGIRAYDTLEELLDKVWGYDAMPTTRTIDVHVAWLRQKIEVNPKYPRHIRTIHKLGYKFTP